MLLSRKILLGLVVILIMEFDFLYDHFLVPIRKNNTGYFPVQSSLQNGDLIFRRGRSPESYAVLVSDRNSPFSHVGIVVKENMQPFIIHAVPGENRGGKDYIKKEKLNDFLSPEKASEYSVYRSYFSTAVNETASRLAYHYYQEKLQFDEKYDLTTNDKLYCTELIMKVYQHASNQNFKLNTTHLNMIFGTLDIIMPGNIMESQYFHPIINY